MPNEYYWYFLMCEQRLILLGLVVRKHLVNRRLDTLLIAALVSGNCYDSFSDQVFFALLVGVLILSPVFQVGHNIRRVNLQETEM